MVTLLTNPFQQEDVYEDFQIGLQCEKQYYCRGLHVWLCLIGLRGLPFNSDPGGRILIVFLGSHSFLNPNANKMRLVKIREDFVFNHEM